MLRRSRRSSQTGTSSSERMPRQTGLLVDPEPSLPIPHRSPAISADRYAAMRVEFSLPSGTVPLMATPRAWFEYRRSA